MASIHDLPAELIHLILSRFVFTDPWQCMLLVSKKWMDVVSVYVPKREKEWKDYLASLKNRYEQHITPNGQPIQSRASGLYEVLREIAKVPQRFCPVSSSTQLIIIYSEAHTTYKSLPLKHLSGFLMRHRLKGEIVILICGTLTRDSLDLDRHVAAMAMRQMTHFALSECPQLAEYAIANMFKPNLHEYPLDYPAVRQSAALFNLSKFVHDDKHWERIKDEDLMHNVVPWELIPSYAILTAELKRANRIEIIAKYFSVNQIVNYYHNWNLWYRVVVLQQIARNIHSLIDPSEYMTLIEFLMKLIVNMSSDRTLIAESFGEFFDIVDVLGHFCTTPLNEDLLGTQLLKMLAKTMFLFQYDFPHLTDVVHGFLVKVRQLMLFMKYDASADPDFIENFYPLWCDDSAIKKRKLWFIKHLLCPQNVNSVKLELEQLIEYEESSTVKRLAQEILGLSISSI